MPLNNDGKFAANRAHCVASETDASAICSSTRSRVISNLVEMHTTIGESKRDDLKMSRSKFKRGTNLQPVDRSVAKVVIIVVACIKFTSEPLPFTISAKPTARRVNPAIKHLFGSSSSQSIQLHDDLSTTLRRVLLLSHCRLPIQSKVTNI